MRGKQRSTSVITKPANRHIELIERLRDRAERERTGLFFAEGVRALGRAVETRQEIVSVTYAPNVLNHSHARRLIARLHSAGVDIHPVSIELFRQCSRLEEPQWVGLTIRQRWTRLDDIDAHRGLCWVALESIRSAGNLGSILRTCQAIGAAGVIAIGASVDPYDPAAVRASMGAVFGTLLVRTSPRHLVAWANLAGAQMIATSPGGDVDFRQMVYRSPLVLLLGGERQGLSAAVQARSHAIVRIPMVGTGDSLNVAVAAGVVLYEVVRQRG